MKKLLAIAAIALFAGSANASYLYWQVDSSDFNGKTDYVTGETIGASASYARVVAVGGEPSTESMVSGSQISVGSGSATLDLSTLGSPDAYSYYIELVNYNQAQNSFEFVAKSETFTYQQLQSSNFIDVGDSLLPPTQVWHGGRYTTTPEPTSGLLVMMGLGLLALKRKKA